MKWLSIASSIGLLLLAAPAFAAEGPSGTDIRFGDTISVGQVTPTPEMWFYEQGLQQYQDPKLAVRRKAEERSAQRRARIAACKWFGLSNARPIAGTDLIHGDYSPGWTSGSLLYPFRWTGFGAAAVVVHATRPTRMY